MRIQSRSIYFRADYQISNSLIQVWKLNRYRATAVETVRLGGHAKLGFHERSMDIIRSTTSAYIRNKNVIVILLL